MKFDFVYIRLYYRDLLYLPNWTDFIKKSKLRGSFKKSFRFEPVVKYKYIIFQFSENRVFPIDQAFCSWAYYVDVRYCKICHSQKWLCIILLQTYYIDEELRANFNKKTILAPPTKMHPPIFKRVHCIKITVFSHTCTLILIQNRGAFLCPENNVVSALSEKCRFLLSE